MVSGIGIRGSVAAVVVLLAAGVAWAQEKVVLDKARLATIGDRFKSVAVLAAGSTPNKLDTRNLTADVKVDRKAWLALQTSAAPVWNTRGADLVCKLPYHFATAAHPDVPELELILIVEGGAVEFQPASGTYLGSVLCGVQPLHGPPGNQSLPDVQLQLVLDPGRAAPDALTLKHVGPPFERAKVSASTVEGETLKVTVVPSFAGREEIQVPVRRPVVALQAPATVQGFGLESVRLSVSASPAAHLKEVSLGISKGSLDPPRVALDAQGTGATNLASSGIGTAEVRVVNRDLRAEVLRVKYVFPVAFLLAALLGGVAGGVVARLRAEKPRPWGNVVVWGALIGLIAAVGIAFGLNLIVVDLAKVYLSRGFSEGIVFLVAALAGLFGLKKPGGAAGPA